MYSKHLNRSNSTYSSNKLNRKFSASGIFPFQLSIAKSAVVVLFFLNAIIIVCLIQALHYTKQENKKLQMKLKQLTAAQSLLEKEQEKPTAQTKIKKDQQYEYSQRKYYPVIINEVNKCKDDNGSDLPVFLLVIIKSLPKNFARRNAIRRTWGNETLFRNIIIKRMFLLGRDGKEHNDRLIKLESEEYKDVLQGDIQESFRNVTKKEFMFMRWLVMHCPHTKYIFKGDDDVFVNMYNIVEYILSRSPKANKDLIIGSVLFPSLRLANPKSKYFVSDNLYNKKHYPPYTSGGGFIMSSLLAKRLFLVMQTTPIIPIDDAFLGICLEKLKVKPINHKGFKSWGMKTKKVKNADFPKRPCYLRDVMVVHKIFEKKLYEAWKILQQVRNQTSMIDKQCSRKFQVYRNGTDIRLS